MCGHHNLGDYHSISELCTNPFRTGYIHVSQLGALLGKHTPPTDTERRRSGLFQAASWYAQLAHLLKVVRMTS